MAGSLAGGGEGEVIPPREKAGRRGHAGLMAPGSLGGGGGADDGSGLEPVKCHVLA